MSFPRCIGVVNKPSLWSNSRITFATVERVVAECTQLIAHCCDEINVWIQQKKLVAVAMSLERSQPNYIAIIYAKISGRGLPFDRMT